LYLVTEFNSKEEWIYRELYLGTEFSSKEEWI